MIYFSSIFLNKIMQVAKGKLIINPSPDKVQPVTV